MVQQNTAQDTKRKRPWPVIVTALLLLVQAAGYSLLNYWRLAPNPYFSLEDGEPGVVVTGMIFTLSGVAFLAGLSCIARRRSAYTHVMFVQGVGLITALVLYATDRPVYTYGIMVACVIVAAYLVVPGVQAAFLSAGAD